MSEKPVDRDVAAEDERTLRGLGYEQELARKMGGFSNYAISLSIICILAGGVTSFHQGLSSVGGAAFGLGWPLVCLFSLAVAATMGQVASSFPTAGGLYHWASILGGKGWGWTTAWLNLLGLVAALAAINLGALRFTLDSLGPLVGLDAARWTPATQTVVSIAGVFAICASQALVNHLGIRLTTRLTDFSGYWIVAIAALLTAAMLYFAPALHPGSLVTFSNFSGARGGDVWPETSSIAPIVGGVLPKGLAYFVFAGIAVAQYLCGLAAVTSVSRIAYAFARDGGMPLSRKLRSVSERYRTPAVAIWTVAMAAALATVYTPVYEIMAAVTAIFLYISYVLPTALGLLAYGRRWTVIGPWHLGRWYRPLAAVSVLGCGLYLLWRGPVVALAAPKAAPSTPPSAGVPGSLSAARRHLKAGEIEQAIVAYRHILTASPAFEAQLGLAEGERLAGRDDVA